MKCFFCDVAAKPDKNVFLSSEHFFARFDDYPISEGHCEIIPKKHIASFFELTSEEVAELTGLLHQAKKYCDKEFNPPAYNIGINDGTEAGQTVPHLHVHLIPRYPGDVPNPKGGVRHIIPEKADYTDKLKQDATKQDYLG